MQVLWPFYTECVTNKQHKKKNKKCSTQNLSHWSRHEFAVKTGESKITTKFRQDSLKGGKRGTHPPAMKISPLL